MSISKYITTGLIFLLLLVKSNSSTGQDIAPQVWSNAFIGWNINEKFSLNNNIAYNVLISEEYPWNELTFSTAGGFSFAKYFDVSLGIYLSLANQSLSLSSFETRPFVGFRVSSNAQKRFFISNLSRFEYRHFKYSDNTTDNSGRLRNRTWLAVALNKPSMVTDKSFYLFGYFEAFYNFNDDLKERFFNLFRYKLGVAYRLNYHWRFAFGLIYQDSKNNVPLPAQYPTNLITNYVCEWTLIYIIGKP